MPVLYVYHDLIKRFGGGSAAQAVAYVGTVEHGGDLPEQFEMFFGRGLRYQQDEEQVDRRAVQRVEVHGSIQVQHGADGALAARQAAVRNGDAIAEAGGTEFFPGHQVFEDGLGVELRQLPGYQVGDLFEYAFLAAARHVHEGTAGGQDLLKSDHRGGEISGRLRLAAVRDTSLCV